MTDAIAPDMAEGQGGQNGLTINWLGRWARWQFASAQGLVVLWMIIAAGAFAGVAGWHFYRSPILANAEAQALFASGAVFAYLPALLLLMDSRSDLAEGPRVYLSLATLATLGALAGLAYVDANSAAPYLRGPRLGTTVQIILIGGFFAYLAAGFLPRVLNAARFASYDHERREQRRAELEAQARAKAQSQSDAFGRVVAPDAPVTATHAEETIIETRDAEAMGALIATVTVSLIGVLAYVAGDGATLSLQTRFGLVLCFCVIGLFAAVVFVDALAEAAPVRSLANGLEWMARRFYWLAAFYDWFDTILVRIGAHVAGMGHRSMAMRYLMLAGSLAALCVMGWYLPAPYGLTPTFFVFVLAISVSRLWSWVEEDRALAAMTEYRTTAPYRMDFREDFRDETLLGFIFVFLAAPIAMMQAHNGAVFGPELFSNADGRSFGDWFGFFGIELAKAIPIVDWAEIYGVETSSDMIAIHGAASRHAIFLARVMVDLVLIASLAQAIGVWTRNRQQKELYRNKHISRLDPFVERVELARAIGGTRSIGAGGAMVFDLTRLRSSAFVDFRRYLDTQLRQIYGSTRNADVRAFIEAIAKQRNLQLSHPIELAIGTAEGNKDEEILFRTFHLALREHDEDIRYIEPDDLYRILTGIRTTQGLHAFKREVVHTMCRIAEPSETVELLSGLAGGEKGERFQYAKDHMIKAMGLVTRRMNDVDEVQRVRAEVRRIARLRNAPSQSAVRSALRTINESLRRLGVKVRRRSDDEE